MRCRATRCCGCDSTAVYSAVVCHLLPRARMGAAQASLLSIVIRLAVAFGPLTSRSQPRHDADPFFTVRTPGGRRYESDPLRARRRRDGLYRIH
jgi:hypothetical protein